MITKKLHIAVDANPIEDSGSRNRGIGRYMKDQFRELALIQPDWKFTLCGVESIPVKPLVDFFGGFSNVQYASWDKFPQVQPDLLYLPNPMGFSTPGIMEIAKIFRVPMVCTFHDLIPMVFPKLYFDPQPALKSFWEKQLERLRNECSLFLCNSQYTADDLFRLANVPRSQLAVIDAGVVNKFAEIPSDIQIETVLRKYNLQKESFLLFTGVPDQRKNSQGMFGGLTLARAALKSDIKLIIAGDCPEFLIMNLRLIQKKFGLLDSAVIFTGYVPDDELNVFYHSALGLLFPSLYEGFGFPIVEAMLAGLPVIAGNNSSQIEAAGDAALLVDPYNVEEIAKAIVSLRMNPSLRNELIRKGKIHCHKFTWRDTAQKTAEYLQKLDI